MAGTPPTPALVAVNDGDMLTANTLNSFGLNTLNLYNYLLSGFYNKKPLYLNLLTANVGVLNNTNTVINWPTPSMATFSSFYSSATPTFITIPKAGWWRLALMCKWDTDNGAGTRAAYLCVNGTDTSNPVAADNRLPTVSGAEGGANFCQSLVHLAQGATVYPVVNQTSGGTYNLVTAMGGTSFSAEWIAPY